MAKVYLAARYSRHPEMRDYATDLIAAGHEVTARWIRGDHEIRSGGHAEADNLQVQWAQEDWADLAAAEIVISFTEGTGEIAGRARGGRHVEFGAALALGKQVVVIGYRENVFHHLPNVRFFSSWAEFLATVTQLADDAVLI